MTATQWSDPAATDVTNVFGCHAGFTLGNRIIVESGPRASTRRGPVTLPPLFPAPVALLAASVLLRPLVPNDNDDDDDESDDELFSALYSSS